MKKLGILFLFILLPFQARADFWGGDLPLLAEIVTNTLNTMMELQKQTTFMNDELAGIKDRIERVRTISEIIEPSSWDKWRDPREALNRLRRIYYAVPKEYRSEKYDTIDDEISKAMNLVSRAQLDSESTFRSGKELERRGSDSSPGVAEKLAASGIGTLIAQQAQSQAFESHITSMLAQILAEGNERETRSVATRGESLKSFSSNLSQNDSRFSRQVLGQGSY